MVVDRKPTVESLGKSYAALVRDDEAVRELWVTEDNDGFIVSILVDEIDADHERRLYRPASEVQRQFPDALFEVHVNNPRVYPGLTFDEYRSTVLPHGARRIALPK
jgi:hypothetical protein